MQKLLAYLKMVKSHCLIYVDAILRQKKYQQLICENLKINEKKKELLLKLST